MLLLLPVAAGAVWLASWRSDIDFALISEDGSFVLSATRVSVSPTRYEVDSLDLRSGRTVRMSRLAGEPPYHLTSDNYWLELQHTSKGVMPTTLIRLETLVARKIPETAVLFGAMPFLLDDRRLVGVDMNGSLLVFNIETGATVRLSSLTTARFGWAIPIVGLDRAIAWESGSTLLTDPAAIQLFAVNDASVEHLGSYRFSTYIGVDDEQLVTLSTGKQLIQSWSLNDGQPIANYSSAPLFEQIQRPEFAHLFKATSIVVVHDPIENRDVLYDFGEGKFLDALPPKVKTSFARDGASILLGNRKTGSLRLFDPTTHRTRPLIPNLNEVTYRPTPDNKRLIVVYQDASVGIFDVATGKLLKTYRSRKWVKPVFAIVFTAFIVWCVLWIRAGIQMGASPLVDIVLLNGLVMGVMVLRINLSGSMEDASRPAFQLAQSLCASWMVLVACWSVLGQMRWTLRIVPPMIGLALTLGIVLLTYRGHSRGVLQVAVGGVGTMALASLWLWLAKRSGLVLVCGNSEGLRVQEARNRWHIPLRDLFVITAAAGALLAVIRFIFPEMMRFWEAVGIGLLFAALSLAGVIAIWAALSPARWRWRLLVASIFLGGPALISTLPSLHGQITWTHGMRLFAASAGWTFTSLLIFRAYGWRLQRKVSKPVSVEA
jgi:hypothetical protein